MIGPYKIRYVQGIRPYSVMEPVQALPGLTPWLFCLHGFGVEYAPGIFGGQRVVGDFDSITRLSDFSAQGYGVVFAQGILNNWLTGKWLSAIDVDYFRRIVKAVRDEFNFDNRCTVVGFSDGAYMAHVLAHMAAESIGGIVSYAGGIPAWCVPIAAANKFPVLAFRGANDWTPTESVDSIAQKYRQAGHQVEAHVVPDCGHAWDTSVNATIAAWLGRVEDSAHAPLSDCRTFGKPRSNKWPSLRKLWLDEHGQCAACGNGRRDELAVHHLSPVHCTPEKELDWSNLITLCGEPCHFQWGHGGLSWKHFNPHCPEDCRKWRARRDEIMGAQAA